MQITGHRQTNLIDFGEYWMNSFLPEYKKAFLYIKAFGVKFFKVFLYLNGTFDFFKLGVYIIGHRPTYYVDFNKFMINGSFTRVKKKKTKFLYLWPME